MKNKAFIYLSLFITVISLSSCLKKGDDDPFISLRSRKGRVVGDWNVVSIKQTTKFTTSGSTPTTTVTTITSDGKTYTAVSTTNGVSTTTSGEVSQKWTFEKDGNYSSTTTVGGDEEKVEGLWNFTSSIGENKNKSQIALSKVKETSGGTQSTFSGNSIDEVYDLTELRHKTMVLSYHRTEADAGGTTDEEYEAELSGE